MAPRSFKRIFCYGCRKRRGPISAENRALNDITNDDIAPVTIRAIDVKIDLLLDDIGASIGPLEAQLAVLAAMVAARDSTGVAYCLKRFKTIWYGLGLSARDLIEADAERLRHPPARGGGVMSASIPPLLAICEGHRVRLRRAPTPRPKEVLLHMSVAKVLRANCLEDWTWFHVPNGEEVRDKRTAHKLRQMGVKPGIPDFVLF